MGESGGEIRLSVSGAPPAPEDCEAPDDLGRVHHNQTADIWYECAFDSRPAVYTWVILPPSDAPMFVKG